MFSVLRRRPKPAPAIPDGSKEGRRRDRQQNIKVSKDCSLAFAALAKAQGLSKAALFEDMVAERFETAELQGCELNISNR